MELFNQEVSIFPTSYSEILQRIRYTDPISYGTTRNYINGAVSYLSPYISRGVVSTKFIFSEIIKKGYPPEKIEKFIQELAWRDYWQQIWNSKGDAINQDLKHQQYPVSNYSISNVINKGNTGIHAIDTAIKKFYKTGYIHNHLRMYIASITCNIGQIHWKIPAKWMYYHLLDADWASNALSWQWVAGTNDNEYIQEILNSSGFKNIKVEKVYTSISTQDTVEKDAELLLNLGMGARLLVEEDLSEDKLSIIKNEIKAMCKNRQNNGEISYKACLNYVSATK